ncbi:hypothetical protein [Pedobacter cryophilus]|uniref:Uncharacterized protein n=1 Tax=Pedobacter cryophilus TaxID=2571271 RepID=A0A4U1C0S1_9SPHI|nr:hypothetical protein [Pedobacter cryophilus]TKB98547.1 hypothetical protein FA046_05350 [Pedobacter cryophilus]
MSKKPVKKKIIKAMVDAYDKRRLRNSQDLPIIIPGEKREDTKSIWVPKETLDKLFADNPTANGLRMYLGVAGNYKVDNDTYTSAENHLGQTTLIFVTTHSSVSPPTMASSVDLLNNDDISISDDDLGGSGLNDQETCPPPPIGSSCTEF